MKKLVLISMVIACFTFVGCTNIESKVDDYNTEILEATKKGDINKCAEIAKEAKEWKESLSEEDQAKANEAWANWENEHRDEIRDAEKSAIEVLEKTSTEEQEDAKKIIEEF